MESIRCVRVWKDSLNYLYYGDDGGLFIVICTLSQHSLVLDMMAGAVGWKESHNIVTLCATPHFKDDEMTKLSLLIFVFKKLHVMPNFTIPQPSSRVIAYEKMSGHWKKDNL